MYEVLELYVLHLPKKIAPSPIGGKVFFKFGQLEVRGPKLWVLWLRKPEKTHTFGSFYDSKITVPAFMDLT